jgi:hypothetical protein
MTLQGGFCRRMAAAPTRWHSARHFNTAEGRSLIEANVIWLSVLAGHQGSPRVCTRSAENGLIH